MKKLLCALMAFTMLTGWTNESRSPQAENDRDEQVAARAKSRMYPGGPDERDLKVQDPLPVPTRKMAPIAEEPRDESAND